MKSTATYVPGEPNTVPQDAQLKLYQLIEELDHTYKFPNGLDVYYQMLTVLNKHFSKLP